LNKAYKPGVIWPMKNISVVAHDHHPPAGDVYSVMEFHVQDVPTAVGNSCVTDTVDKIRRTKLAAGDDTHVGVDSDAKAVGGRFDGSQSQQRESSLGNGFSIDLWYVAGVLDHAGGLLVAELIAICVSFFDHA